MKALDKKALEAKAKEIMDAAEEKGVQSNFFFITTFQRYLTQISILQQLEEIIHKEEEVLVTKEYVKGRKNLYSNPAVNEYNKTTDSANKTIACLLKIVRSFSETEPSKSDDALMDAINGDDGDEE